MKYIADIGLEIHAELNTRTKMFCSCPVVDPTQVEPNIAVCPVCEGLPGTLPVVNQKAVELGIRAALALECKIASQSVFARKNYFYPDLPKGFQISQYELPLAEHGRITISTTDGERVVRIRRVHLEEDTGKLSHVSNKKRSYSLIDLNRAGVPLLEIVSEPDLHSAEEAGAYARSLRSILKTLGANTGNMEKGALRLEANVSMRVEGSNEMGTRVEIKNLNSFRAMERAISYQLVQQKRILETGGAVEQETLGWDDLNGLTISQRSKEEAHDYRYFPEPDLPPLVVDQGWVDQLKSELPELPRSKAIRFERDLGIRRADAHLLAEDLSLADYFERAVHSARTVPAKVIGNWILGELQSWMNEKDEPIETIKISPDEFAKLVGYVHEGKINQSTGKLVLIELLQAGGSAEKIIEKKGLQQVSDSSEIGRLVADVLSANPGEVEKFQSGKRSVEQWLFGQVMRAAGGKANPAVIREELSRQLHSQ